MTKGSLLGRLVQCPGDTDILGQEDDEELGRNG